MRAPSRSIAVAMVPAGTISGHAVGYFLAGGDAGFSGAHHHLRPWTWVASALVVAALAGFAVRRRPQHGWSGPHLAWGVPAQVALFGLLEVAEHLVSGHGAMDAIAEPSFRWGVAAQVATAAVLIVAARLARASGECLRARGCRPAVLPEGRRPRWAGLPAVVPRRRAVSAVSERGPPRLAAPA